MDPPLRAHFFGVRSGNKAAGVMACTAHMYSLAHAPYILAEPRFEIVLRLSALA